MAQKSISACLPSSLIMQWCASRQSEGGAPEGYTVQEACLLSCSSQSKQREAALRLLTAVLRQARPHPSECTPAGLSKPSSIALPKQVRQRQSCQVTIRQFGKRSNGMYGGHTTQQNPRELACVQALPGPLTFMVAVVTCCCSSCKEEGEIYMFTGRN